MDTKTKLKLYDGSTDVREFITKCALECSVKDYADEKKANYLGSKLTGHAFDVYMRLSDANKASFDAIRDELYQEFEHGNRDREEAIQKLASRQHLPTESVQTFAYKLTELVKLAYPESTAFTAATQNTIAKDYFVRGLHPAMQIALKCSPNFRTMDLKAATDETVRLELAGVKTYGSSRLTAAGINSVNFNRCFANENDTDTGFINSIADKVAERLQETGISTFSSSSDTLNSVSWSGNRGANRYRGNRGRRGRGRGRGNSNSRKCRGCESTNHIVRDCPQRFCQACGKQGHDQSNPSCEKYRL